MPENMAFLGETRKRKYSINGDGFCLLMSRNLKTI